jgi:hypothetical protein
VAVTWNVIDVETVEPPSGTAAPLPSTAEVIVVCVGGCTTVDVAITETVPVTNGLEDILATSH